MKEAAELVDPNTRRAAVPEPENYSRLPVHKIGLTLLVETARLHLLDVSPISHAECLSRIAFLQH